ncbi:DUF1778 domain-containing protein [Smaragdicoccus niigatensis]|uniref:type II toxin -antitoxin system TacA 1-like antitoxin n=1 Tax=Smaragdicoccus niigatensis TaxID=359359 RepID=UPI0003A24E36|nr:DUF1778 domain-containing protein [Smaragdicoccus niigatensis]
MPNLELTFTESEMELLRTAANASGQSLEAFVHDAVLRSANDNGFRARVEATSRLVAEKSGELNRRLR